MSTFLEKALGDNLGNICTKKPPTITTVGIAIIIPYNNTSPKFAFNSLAITTGPGCGGKKPCVTDNAIAIGIPIFICDTPKRLAIVNANGINNTNPTSKNNAIPIINDAKIIAHLIY